MCPCTRSRSQNSLITALCSATKPQSGFASVATILMARAAVSIGLTYFFTVLRSPVEKAVDAPRFSAARKRPLRDVTAYVHAADVSCCNVRREPLGYSS